MDKALLDYVIFFNLDLAIKKQIFDLNGKDYLSYDKLVKYADKLYDGTNSLKNKFLNICKIFNMSNDILVTVCEFMDKIRDHIVNTDYSEQDLKNIYNYYFASMSVDRLNEIRKNIYGDSTIYDDIEEWVLVEIINNCTSVNELLHVFHQYAINNLDALRSVSEIAYKENEKWSVTLRGEDSDLARQVYDSFDISIDVGTTDIVAISDDKILITVRDRGHALQIETEEKNDKEIGVYYFIPKVLEPEMFDNIKGITKVEEGDTFAVGSFVTDKENVGSEIFNIVKKVPSDYDYIEFMHQNNRK